MSAVVIDFATAAARRKPRACARVAPQQSPTAALASDFTFWRGASGARYVHTIYPLLECPELPDCIIVLVHRYDNGRAEVVHVGTVEHDAVSLNLAGVRQAAALKGANEVHVHLLGETSEQRRTIAADIAAAGELAASGFGPRH